MAGMKPEMIAAATDKDAQQFLKENTAEVLRALIEDYVALEEKVGRLEKKSRPARKSRRPAEPR
jgi:hypothetical protein